MFMHKDNQEFSSHNLKSPVQSSKYSSVSPNKASKNARIGVELIKEFDQEELIDEIQLSPAQSKRLTTGLTVQKQSQPSGLVALFRQKNHSVNRARDSSSNGLESQESDRNQQQSKEIALEQQDTVSPLMIKSKGKNQIDILSKFQNVYQKLNPSQSVDSNTLRKSLKTLVLGKKSFQRGSIQMGLVSPFYSQKSNQLRGQDSISDSIDSTYITPTMGRLIPNMSVLNELLMKARLRGVETLNEYQSEDDEMYQDSEQFIDPQTQNSQSSFLRRQSTENKGLPQMTPQKSQLHQVIMSSEVMTNQIFERVFMNDLPGIKKLNEGFLTYFDRKKKFNLRDIYKRSVLFYSLAHSQSYDMVEFLVSNGCDTLFIDFRGRTPLHYACILGCDKKIVQFMIDYNKELDKFRAHTKEAMEEFKDRPMKNFDITPSNQDIMNHIESQKQSTAQQQQQNGHSVHANSFLSLVQSQSQANNSNNHNSSSNNTLTLKSENKKQNSDLTDVSPMKTRKKANVCVSLKEYHSMGKQTSKLRDYFQSKVDKELLRQQRASLTFTKDQEELFKRMKFEKKYKKSEEYIESLIQYVNLVDNKGMTALHYAVKGGNLEIIKLLVSSGANLLIRDYKLRQPIDCNLPRLEIQAYLKSERMEFEAYFHTLKKTKNRNDVQKAINMFIDQPSRLTTMKFLSKRRLIVDQKNLSSKNNQQLETFMYGIYQDNVLTYLMRINDMETFEYILRREVSPLSANQNDLNVVHIAIQLEKIKFLSYLFEGDYFQYENDGLNEDTIESKHQRLVQIINETDRYSKKQWVIQSLIALDKCSLNEGYTPLILSLKSEKDQYSNYILQIALVREKLRQNEEIDIQIREKFSKLEDFICYFDKKQKTALLTAAKHGHLQSFKILFNMGANFYATCSKLNNALHYAIMSENEKLIQFVSWSDAENSTGQGLMSQGRNIKGMVPIDYDRKKRFYDTVYHIWDCASSVKSQSALERLLTLIKNGAYKINQQTVQGQNTALHFAVMYENIKAIALLLKQPGVSMNIKNKEGKIPIDYAHLIANKTSQFQICNSLQKALSVHYKSTSNKSDNTHLQFDQNLSENNAQPQQRKQKSTQNQINFKIQGNSENNNNHPPILQLQQNQSSTLQSPQKLQPKNHQNTIMPSHQFTITEQGHLYRPNQGQRKYKQVQDYDILEESNDDSSIMMEDIPKLEIIDSVISVQYLENTIADQSKQSHPKTLVVSEKIQIPQKQNQNNDQNDFLKQQNLNLDQNISPFAQNLYTSSKLLDAREILKQKLTEYREFFRQPQLLVGKFPMEIFKKWYDQYNQIYTNREIEKLQQLFLEIFATLKDQHEKNIKLQIAMMNSMPSLKQVAEGGYRSSENNAYYIGKRQFNGENYLTYRQLEPYIDLIIDRMEMQKQEGKQFKEFMPIYYEDTKISITEFCQHLMNKFKVYQQTKQQMI
eukprot:403356602